MAKLVLIGDMAHVEILADPGDEEVVLARCFLHPAVRRATGDFCEWKERYDTLDDATQYAESHADRGTA